MLIWPINISLILKKMTTQKYKFFLNNQRQRALIIFYITLSLLVSITAKANTTDTLSEVQHLCESSPSKCLPEVNDLLQSSQAESRVWFKLLLMKFDALYALEHNEELLKLVTPWKDRTDTPLYFRVFSYIYYAKEVNYKKNKAEAQLYLKKALALLAQFNKAYKDPLMLVQVVNLQLYFPDQLQSAYNNLLTIEKRFEKSRDPHFKLELYANLGHLADRLKKPKEQILYREKSLAASKIYNNKQQIGITEYNLARILQEQDRLLEATIHYKEAIKYGSIAKDVALLNSAKLHLTEIHLKQHQTKLAQDVFNTIDTVKLASGR